MEQNNIYQKEDAQLEIKKENNEQIIQIIIKNIDKNLNLELNNSNQLIKEGLLKQNTKPLNKKEIDELYTKESAMCKIKFQKIIDAKIRYGEASGFFCIIQDDEIPFNKVLMTNNHVIDRNSIKPKNYIKIVYLNKNKLIQIQENRRCFTNEKLDYTCIEIFDSDGIEDYFQIDSLIFSEKK